MLTKNTAIRLAKIATRMDHSLILYVNRIKVTTKRGAGQYTVEKEFSEYRTHAVVKAGEVVEDRTL